MEKIIIRDATEHDYPDIIKLNADQVEFTSPMDIDRLKLLDSLADYHRVVVTEAMVVAFMLAMKTNVPYENDNYNWFSSRYKDFLYIDRVVVAAGYQGRRIGTLFYEDLFEFARKNEIPLVTCEINTLPPNERSLAFHAKLGFQEVGEQWIQNRKKVSMQVARISF